MTTQYNRLNTIRNSDMFGAESFYEDFPSIEKSLAKATALLDRANTALTVVGPMSSKQSLKQLEAIQAC